MTHIFPERVTVLFEEHRNTVSYAVDLAALLNVPLLALVPVSPSDTDIAAKLSYSTACTLRATMHQRIGSQLHTGAANTHTAHSEIGAIAHAHTDIHVSCMSHDVPSHVPRLSPAGERNVFRSKKGSIFVPIGDGPSGLVGAQYAIAIAKRLDTRIVFWHTTWRNVDIAENDPLLHVCSSAHDVSEIALHLAAQAQVRASLVVECAPRLVEGLITTALHSGASLIVMAEGRHKTFGTYTDRVRARNCPVPLLVTPKEFT